MTYLFCLVGFIALCLSIKRITVMLDKMINIVTVCLFIIFVVMAYVA